MKTKSISFAEVLRKTTKSPRVEAPKTAITLEEMTRMFEADPQEDYTLYLGRFNTSQKAKPSSFQMTFSRNTIGDNQEEMFDSWIQKQSAKGPNKENIRNQPQKMTRNEPIKRAQSGFRKIINNSKAKENAYPTNSTSTQRQCESNYLQVPQPNFVPLNIEMIKSKGYQGQQNINKGKSPKNQKKIQGQTFTQPTTANLQYQNQNNSGNSKHNAIKIQPTFKEMKQLKQSEKTKYQSIKSTQKFSDFKVLSPKQANNNIQNRQVQDEISDIAGKYLNANYSPQAEAEEQLLLQNQNSPQQQKISTFNQAKTKKQQNEEIMKKRMEQAKKMIGNCLGKLKNKHQIEAQEKNDIYLINPHYQDHRQSNITDNHMVGYSFSNNFPGVNQSPNNQQVEHRDNQIPDVVSEAPDQTQSPLNDSTSFKNKYLNLKSFEGGIQENQHIKNIQSVKYDGDDYQNLNQHEKPYEIPNDTFRPHLIMAKDQENRVFQEVNPQSSFKNQISSFKEEPLALKNFASYESNPVEAETVKPISKSRQKISLISSRSKSNKASPSVTNKQQKVPEVNTTDFTIDPLKNTLEKIEKIEKSFQNPSVQIKNEQKQSYSSLIAEKYQYNFKTEGEIKQKQVKQSLHVSPPNTKISHEFVPFVVSQKKIQQADHSQYNAPTYAKPTSRLADITSDYYSAPSYAQPTPKYQPLSHYETPTYGNQINAQFTTSRTVENLPLKIESPYTYDIQKEISKENSVAPPSTINSFERKYALPTQYFSNTEIESKKNYLQKLEIKESITVQDTKPKESYTYNPVINNPIQTYGSIQRQFKTINPIASSKNSFKVSLKQSINVQSSQEFVFDL